MRPLEVVSLLGQGRRGRRLGLEGGQPLQFPERKGLAREEVNLL